MKMKMNTGSRKPSTDSLNERLKAFGMRAETVRIEVTSKNGENRSWALRLVLPDSAGTICCNEQLLGLGFESLSQPRLTRTLNLLLFDEVVTDPKRRLLRRLGCVSLRRTPSIREARKILKGKATVAELVRALGQDAGEPDEQLFDRAVYETTSPFGAVDRMAYEGFSDMVLNEVADLYESITEGEIGRKAFERAQRAHRRRGIELPDCERSEGRWQAHLDRLWPRVLRRVTKKAIEIDEARSSPWQPIARQAGALLGIPSAEGPTSGRIDTKRANAVIQKALEALRDHEDDEWRRRTAAQLNGALRSRTRQAKVNALVGIWSEFQPRSAMYESLMREADVVSCFVCGQGARAVYRQIRGLLTIPERRIFCLMYMQRLACFGREPGWPFFGWTMLELPFVDSLIEDTELIALGLLVHGLKCRELFDTDLAAECRLLYRKHLSFYSWWARIVRFDDRNRKRAVRRVAKEHRTQIAENIPDPGLESPQSVDVPAPREFFASLIRKAEDHRPLKRYRIARMYLVEGRTQQEIANLDGISQAAVSKMVRNFVEKDLPNPRGVRKMLERGGYFRRGRPRRL